MRDAFHLLLQLRRGPALAGGRGRFADECLHRDTERLRDHRQRRDLNPPSAHFVGRNGLLRDAEDLGELHLGDALFFAQMGDASADFPCDLRRSASARNTDGMLSRLLTFTAALVLACASAQTHANAHLPQPETAHRAFATIEETASRAEALLSASAIKANCHSLEFCASAHSDYANNSPYKFTDPDGRNAFAALELTLGAVAVDAATPDPTDVAAPVKGLSYSAAIVGTAIGGTLVWGYNAVMNESTKPEGQTDEPKETPSLPTGLVGDKPQATGKNGGTAVGTSLPAGDYEPTVKGLTGGNLSPHPKIPGAQQAPNGVVVRPGKYGPRIDIPANGTKPPEIIHFPKGADGK